MQHIQRASMHACIHTLRVSPFQPASDACCCCCFHVHSTMVAFRRNLLTGNNSVLSNNNGQFDCINQRTNWTPEFFRTSHSVRSIVGLCMFRINSVLISDSNLSFQFQEINTELRANSWLHFAHSVQSHRWNAAHLLRHQLIWFSLWNGDSIKFPTDLTLFTARAFVCAFTMQISIHNTLLINTTFICIKYTPVRWDAESKKSKENTRKTHGEEKTRCAKHSSVNKLLAFARLSSLYTITWSVRTRKK